MRTCCENPAGTKTSTINLGINAVAFYTDDVPVEEIHALDKS
jgi:hypothetical protein